MNLRSKSLVFTHPLQSRVANNSAPEDALLPEPCYPQRHAGIEAILIVARHAAEQTREPIFNGQPYIAAAFSHQVAKQQRSSFHTVSSVDRQPRCGPALSLPVTSVAIGCSSQPTLLTRQGFRRRDPQILRGHVRACTPVPPPAFNSARGESVLNTMAEDRPH